MFVVFSCHHSYGKGVQVDVARTGLYSLVVSDRLLNQSIICPLIRATLRNENGSRLGRVHMVVGDICNTFSGAVTLRPHLLTDCARFWRRLRSVRLLLEDPIELTHFHF